MSLTACHVDQIVFLCISEKRQETFFSTSVNSWENANSHLDAMWWDHEGMQTSGQHFGAH
jgi:hypothetical protein